LVKIVLLGEKCERGTLGDGKGTYRVWGEKGWGGKEKEIR